MEYQDIDIKPQWLAGLQKGTQIHYTAPTPRLFMLEVSILQQAALNKLSFLPPPEYVDVDPKQVKLRVPVTEAEGVVRPVNASDARKAIQNTVLENSGTFINGYRIRRASQAKDSLS